MLYSVLRLEGSGSFFLKRFFVQRLTRVTIGATLTGLVAVGVPGAVTSARAACPGTIVAGETATTTQTLSTAGQDCAIEEGGAITLSGDDQIGVDGKRRSHTISNAGTITINGDRGRGVRIRRNGNTVTNRGTISLTGNRNHGINITSDNNTITNFGTIVIDGLRGRGIRIEGNNNQIINSGLIRASGTNSYAIRITESNSDKNTLTLLPGTRIIGLIRLSSVGEETLNILTGAGSVFTFHRNGKLPDIVFTDGLPYLAVTPAAGNPFIVVIDPSGFASAGAQLSNLTANIANTIHARLDSRRPPRDDDAEFSDFDDDAAPLDGAAQIGVRAFGVDEGKGFGVWAQVFGSRLEKDAKGRVKKSEHDVFGALIGFDAILETDAPEDLHVGAFIGLSKGDTTIGSKLQKIDTDSLFGGFYGEYAQNGWYARMVLMGGMMKNESTRLVLDNMLPDGFWNATASYDGVFVSPEIAAGYDFPLNGMTITPALRVRYAHLALDSYTETGAPGAAAQNIMGVDSREIDLFSGRAQIAITRTWGNFILTPRFGVEAYTSNSDDVTVRFAGQSLSFAPGGDDDGFSGFVGASLSTDIGDRFSLFADGEAHFGDGFTRYEGRIGVMMRF